jgi:urea transport system permease protein
MNPRRLTPLLYLLLAGLCWLTAVPVRADDAFVQALTQLTDRNFRQREAAVDLVAAAGRKRAMPVLKALLNGKLYYRRSDRLVVLTEPAGDDYHVRSAVDGSDLGTATDDDIKRIGTDNRMRSAIRGALAEFDLIAADPAVRLGAVRQMLRDGDPSLGPRLRRLLRHETDTRVRAAMQTGLAVADLAGSDRAAQLAAVQALSGNLEPEVREALAKAAGSPPPVGPAAAKALKQINGEVRLFGYAETLFFGLSLGSVLVLAAIGLAITFGVMGVINMAHGELIMLGAYTTYLVQQWLPNHIGVSVFIAIPAAFLVSGLVGILIERGIIRFLYGRPLETLLATFGVSLVLQQMVRTLISPQNVPVQNPDWMSGAVQINSVLSLTVNRVYILVFALLVFAALFLVLKRTVLGLQVRAVSQNRAMARAMGVRSEWVDALTFGLGSGIAGVAGVALSQLTNVGPNLGQSYIVDSFMVVVFGGVGNLWGTLIGGQQAPGALGRRGAGQDSGAVVHHPVHPETPARAVPAARPRRGWMNDRCARLAEEFIAFMVPTLQCGNPSRAAPAS